MLRLHVLPPLRKRLKSRGVFRPIVESGRIEIGAVGPDQGADLRVDLYLVEDLGVTQGAINFTS